MEEILRSTCTLAQDQYGNYVVQVYWKNSVPKPNQHFDCECQANMAVHCSASLQLFLRPMPPPSISATGCFITTIISLDD